MRRYWVDAKTVTADAVTFSHEIFHHIFDVCRQEVGNKFEILTGDSNAHLVEVTSVGKKSAEARIIESRVIPPLSKPHIHLVLAIPRFPVMEAVVEKAVEMGVHTLHPVFSEFSFIRKSSSLPESKFERWNKIVVSATQQSGRGELMKLAHPADLSQVQQSFNRTINPTTGRLGLFAFEGSAAGTLKQYIHQQKSTDIEEIWVFVGGEGGFSPTEVQEFQGIGLKSLTLGEQVLRVETACITMLAILKYEFVMR